MEEKRININRDITKSFNNLEKIINLDVKCIRDYDIIKLNENDNNRRKLILNELEKLEKNKYDKNTFNNIKEMTYNEVGVLGKTSFDIYNSDLNWNRFRNAVNIIKACNRMKKLTI